MKTSPIDFLTLITQKSIPIIPISTKSKFSIFPSKWHKMAKKWHPWWNLTPGTHSNRFIDLKNIGIDTYHAYIGKFKKISIFATRVAKSGKKWHLPTSQRWATLYALKGPLNGYNAVEKPLLGDCVGFRLIWLGFDCTNQGYWILIYNKSILYTIFHCLKRF